MKTSKLSYAFNFVGVKRQLVIAASLIVSTSAFAQLANPTENNQIPWSNVHFVYEEQPNLSVYTSPEAASAMPSALATETAAEVNDVTVWDHSSDNHLLVMLVNTVRKNLTATVYDSKGNRVMFEIPIDAGTYRMVEHTRNLEPGKYFLYLMERGNVIGKEQFEVK